VAQNVPANSAQSTRAAVQTRVNSTCTETCLTQHSSPADVTYTCERIDAIHTRRPVLALIRKTIVDQNITEDASVAGCTSALDCPDNGCARSSIQTWLTFTEVDHCLAV